MTLHFVSRDISPNYTALSTDISGGKIAGANIIGATIYLTDTNVWKIINYDLSIGNYSEGGSDVNAEYSAQTQSSAVFPIIKGSLNHLRLRPKILNEHAESSREAMGTVTATTNVGQFFKTSQDNINGISIIVQSAATFASMDTITSGGGEKKAGTIEYSGDAALQAEYIKSGSVEGVRSAFTDSSSETQDGSYALEIPSSTATDSWTVTLTSTDLSGVTFNLKTAQTQPFSNAKVYFFIGDGTNTKSFPLTATTANLWHNFSFEETDMVVETTDLTATTPTMTTITKMGFRIDDSHPSSFAYADSITYQAEGGTFDVELWDFGTTLPIGGGTEDYTSNGTQYTELGDKGITGVSVSAVNVQLHGGKRTYHLDDFVAGTALEIPTNTILTVGNYYAFVIAYVDTDVTIYGPNTTFAYDYYSNGYAWKAEVADNHIDRIAGASGAGAYSDLAFSIFSTQNIKIIGTYVTHDSAPGESARGTINAEDSNMSIVALPSVFEYGGFGRTTASLETTDRPILLEKGGKYELNYTDDASDSLTKTMFAMRYLFIPPTVNG